MHLSTTFFEAFRLTLEFWNARMEDLEGSSWVHIDFAPVKSKRFFKP